MQIQYNAFYLYAQLSTDTNTNTQLSNTKEETQNLRKRTRESEYMEEMEPTSKEDIQK